MAIDKDNTTNDQIDGLTENQAKFILKAVIAAGRVQACIIDESIALAKSIVVE